jgi:hypothetical protein
MVSLKQLPMLEENSNLLALSHKREGKRLQPTPPSKLLKTYEPTKSQQ